MFQKEPIFGILQANNIRRMLARIGGLTIKEFLAFLQKLEVLLSLNIVMVPDIGHKL